MKPKTNGLRGRPDFLLLVLTLLLVGFGLIMVFSASSNTAAISKSNNFDALYFTKRQLEFALLGTIGMFVVMNIPFTAFKKGFIIYFFPVLIMLILVPFIGKSLNGARSWFGIGSLGIQPTEFAKLGLVLYLGSLIAKKGEKFRDFKKGLVPVFIIIAIICGLIMLQPDLGACIVIAAASLIIIVAGGANLKQLFLSSIIIGFIVTALVSASMLHDPDGWSYRINRFTAFMDPTSDMQNTTYHLSRSLEALGHGGITGAGFGHSVQKLKYMPYPYSDFIFSVIGEEFGFIGSLLFLLFYLFFIWRGMLVAIRCPDNYGTIVGVGIVGLIAVQAIVNIGGVTGAMPLTGVTLPFISHGGSSLIVCLLGMGILLSISREYNRPEKTLPANRSRTKS
ncbi:putative lipid II flippase FtsW [Paenibacillus sacheonensis]|uniref:Probable peptidoglycan glycosyltransferase FtsW n=1 Tax=Paenibacillus sacheonensis TaxID=742054 RepID=A0A7X4YRK0_9BACL|nr:putative lipid II flippase FtsW [Paenibacillus sacheonensis]MBM7563531.1 cell division protein FtsW [Paenibacillus sacheonensis]NBC71170.1 putative lipid II flippase FtsW [Paenibacillus sacheonensis]